MDWLAKRLMLLMTCSLLALALAGSLHAAESTDAAGGVAGRTEWLQVATGRLKARTYVSSTATARPILVIVLHGDAPFNKPDYQYFFAKRSASLGDVVAAAILRPGYTDPAGDTSSGVRGSTTGDNYTRDRIDAIAAAITALRDEYRARAVVMVGHSGGAAISADILALYPKLARAALLVSCPCDLTPWRQHMKTVAPTPLWDQPVQSLSALDLASGVSSSTKVHMVVGSADHIAPPQFTQIYAAALSKRHIDVQVTQLPDKDHEIFLDPAVQVELAALLKSIDQR
jgi:pimeloyl-ACP methyl ester carboxylesterase